MSCDLTSSACSIVSGSSNGVSEWYAAVLLQRHLGPEAELVEVEHGDLVTGPLAPRYGGAVSTLVKLSPRGWAQTTRAFMPGAT